MSFNINKQLNAEDQEPMAADAAEDTATTNEPVEQPKKQQLKQQAPEPTYEAC